MPKPKDRVQLVKQESVSGGGTASDDSDFLGDFPLDPEQDAPDLAGIYLQESGVARDKTVVIYRENNQMYFEDGVNSGSGRATLTELLTGSGVSGLTEAQHKALRQLIHFINDGPAEGFASGAVKTTAYSGAFPTSEIWYESAAKTQPIVKKTNTYIGAFPITEEWKMYDTDGSTVLVTVTDSIIYTGAFETERTRTIVV